MLTVLALIALLAVASAHAAKPRDRISPPRERVVRMLDAGLAGTPMAHTGRQLEAAGWKHRVSPYLMAAIAGVESGYGRLHCSQSRYWIFGLGSCGRAWMPPYFRSWREAYGYFARFLAERWIARGVGSATSIGYTYCPPCGARWGAAVEWHMRRVGWPTAVGYH